MAKAARMLTYRDALTVMTGQDKAAVASIDKLISWSLLAGVPFTGAASTALIGPKNEIRRINEDALSGLAAKARGLKLRDRSQRISASLCILTVNAIIEASNEILGDSWVSLEISDAEVQRIVLGVQTGVSDSTTSLYTFLQETTSPNLDLLGDFQSDLRRVEKHSVDYVRRLERFLIGLAFWDSQGETDRARTLARLHRELPVLVRSKYEQNFRRLAAEAPELAIWLGVREHASTRQLISGVAESIDALAVNTQDQISRLAAVLRDTITESASAPNKYSESLATYYQAALKRPLVEFPDNQSLDDVAPTITALYVEPACSAVVVGSDSRPSEEMWWEPQEEFQSTQDIIAQYLTNPASSERPMVLLGHPGAGKSVTMKVLAAQLDPNVFLPIHVSLRDVSASGSVQSQIDESLYQILGRNLSWVDLSDSSQDLSPVILLDGLDELIQATGTSKSNYLEMVREFQWTSSSRGSPVAVIVTSRTAVAHITRIPTGSLVVKLNPFDPARIAEWVRKWNSHLRRGATSERFKALRIEAVNKSPELSSHPVLLLMIALYEMESDLSLADSIDLLEGDLYERLLTLFAQREVKKRQPDLDPSGFIQQVERELYALSIIALGMFNRGDQTITQEAVDVDFGHLGLDVSPTRPKPENLDVELPHSTRMLGRFFFLSHTVANNQGHSASPSTSVGAARSFEFMHATFGEFLVARLLVILANAARMQLPAKLPWGDPEIEYNDRELQMFYSAQAISKRLQIVKFVYECALRYEGDQHLYETVSILLYKRLRDPQQPRANVYIPYGQPHYEAACIAAYSANLTVLVAATFGRLEVNKLLRSTELEMYTSWRRLVSLWESQLDHDAWLTLLQILRRKNATRTGLEFGFDIESSLSGESDVDILYYRLNDFNAPELKDQVERIPDTDHRLCDVVHLSPLFGTAATRSAEMRNDLLDESRSRLIGYLREACGVTADTIFTDANDWIVSRENSVLGEGLISAQLLVAAAYPPMGAGDPAIYSVLIELVHRSKHVSTLLMRQIMRQVYLEAQILPTGWTVYLLDRALLVGPAEPDVDYYSLILRTAARAWVAAEDQDDTERLLWIASSAFDRLDVLSLLEVQPQVYVRLLIEVESVGLSIADVAETFGSVEDHLSRVNAGMLSNDVPCALSIIRFMRQRLIVRAAAQLGVNLLNYLPDDVFENQVSDQDIHFVYLSCQAYRVLWGNAIADLKSRIESLRPDILNGVKRWQFDAESGLLFSDYLKSVGTLPEFGSDIYESWRPDWT